MEVLVALSCLTLCNTMDYSPPGSSVHGILQGRILEWIAMPSSRGSSRPRDGTHVSCIGGRFLPSEASGVEGQGNSGTPQKDQRDDKPGDRAQMDGHNTPSSRGWRSLHPRWLTPAFHHLASC